MLVAGVSLVKRVSKRLELPLLVVAFVSKSGALEVLEVLVEPVPVPLLWVPEPELPRTTTGVCLLVHAVSIKLRLSTQNMER